MWYASNHVIHNSSIPRETVYAIYLRAYSRHCLAWYIKYLCHSISNPLWRALCYRHSYQFSYHPVYAIYHHQMLAADWLISHRIVKEWYNSKIEHLCIYISFVNYLFCIVYVSELLLHINM